MLAQKSQNTRANIYEASERLFLERNYADVTMDQIAAASGLTKGALYHHFTNKEQLYVEMMVEDLKQKQSLFLKASQEGKSCREKLEKLTRVYLELPALKQDLIKLVRRDINVFNGALRQTLVRAYQEALPNIIEGILKQGVSTEERFRRETRMLSWFYVALVECTLGSFSRTAFATPQEKVDYVLDFFFHGARPGNAAKQNKKNTKTRGAKKRNGREVLGKSNPRKIVRGKLNRGKISTRKKGDPLYGKSL